MKEGKAGALPLDPAKGGALRTPMFKGFEEERGADGAGGDTSVGPPLLFKLLK